MRSKYKREDLTPSVIKELVELKDGQLYWKNRDRKWFSCDRSMKTWNSKFSGKRVLYYTNSKDPIGKMTILGCSFRVSRVKFCLENGKFPDGICISVEDGAFYVGTSSERAHIFSGTRKDGKYHGVTPSGLFSPGRGRDVSFSAFHSSKLIGMFPTPIEAARAYDSYVFSLYGENAVLNFPEEYGLQRKESKFEPDGYFD